MNGVASHPTILIVAGSRNPLLDQLQRHLRERGLRFAFQSIESCSSRGRIASWRSVLLAAVRCCWNAHRTRFDVAAFHFFSPTALLVAVAMALTHKPFVIHFWGSDFDYWKSRNILILRWVLRRASSVSFANSVLMNQAHRLWGSEVRLTILRFGLDSLDEIDGLPEPRDSQGCPVTEDSRLTTVVVGTNSQPAQQHASIIKQLLRLPINLQRRCRFVFPLNYGDRANRLDVLKLLSSATFKHTVLDEMIYGAELARFRQATDVLIQVQLHDALSGAMLESLYAGACVITGSWLPYDDLRHAGVDWLEVDSVTEVGRALHSAIDRTVDTKMNRSIVASLSRWGTVADEWHRHYTLALRGERDAGVTAT